MSETKHTPGPWTATRTGWGVPKVVDSASRNICVSAWHKGDDRANARLIAAAPELLEACKQARLNIDGLQSDGSVTLTDEGQRQILAILDAAIAKAEQK